MAVIDDLQSAIAAVDLNVNGGIEAAEVKLVEMTQRVGAYASALQQQFANAIGESKAALDALKADPGSDNMKNAAKDKIEGLVAAFENIE